MKLIFITTLFLISNSLYSNDLTNHELEIKRYEKDVEIIHDSYKSLNLNSLEKEYDSFIDAVQAYEKNQTESNFEHLEKIAQKIKFFDTLKREEELNKEITSSKYFDLSAKVFQYKNRVDNLYIQERGSGSFYGGMETHSNSVIQKKKLYVAGMEAFEKTMLEVKHTNPCNYSQRIDLLKENKRLLVKMEKLLNVSNTKELEKQLKNEKESKKIMELIFNYPVN